MHLKIITYQAKIKQAFFYLAHRKKKSLPLGTYIDYSCRQLPQLEKKNIPYRDLAQNMKNKTLAKFIKVPKPSSFVNYVSDIFSQLFDRHLLIFYQYHQLWAIEK